MSAAAAIFVDKDGTLVDDVPYNVDPDRIALSRGAQAAVQRFFERGYRVIVVSNQPGAALGLFEERALQQVERRLKELLENALAGFYYCPHHPEAGCRCRKPNPGMLLRAAREHGVRLERSWMIGDILDDVEAGRRAGCRTCLIDNGNETEWKMTEVRRPDCVAADLAEAARLILQA